MICATAGSVVSFAGEGTFTALSDDASAAVFGPANLTSWQDTGGSAKAGASSASVGTEALRGASGNLAAGALNVQTSQIALIATPQAEVTTQQNVHALTQLTGSAIAGIGPGAMSAVSGNVGMNIAGGVGNAQSNGMVVHRVTTPETKPPQSPQPRS